MTLYLAGTESRQYVLGGGKVDLYLAGNVGSEKWQAPCDVPILESFHYITPEAEKKIPHIKKFLLDSGAFTFFSGGHNVVWEEYVDRYADFINRFQIERFFELDIDSLIGFDAMIKLRRRLERVTGKQPIPVWHISRGIEQFKRDAEEYPYVALGGIAGKSWSAKQQEKYPWFIREAHKRGAKIHALGYTSLTGIQKNHFDSVDSTAWTTGNRFGYIYKFDGKTMQKINVPRGMKLRTQEVAQHNFDEWAKFSKYAKTHFNEGRKLLCKKPTILNFGSLLSMSVA